MTCVFVPRRSRRARGFVSIDLGGSAGSSRARRRCSTPSATTSRARPRTWPHSCSSSTRSTSARAGSRRCASGRAVGLLHRGVGAGGLLRSRRRWSNAELRALPAAEVAAMLGPGTGSRADGAVRGGAARLGGFSAGAGARAGGGGGGSAERLASMLASMPFFDDAGFWKRRRSRNDLALAGVADLRRPRPAHDLRGQPGAARAARRRRAALRPALAARIDAGELLAPGVEEREIRAARCTPAS